MCQSLSFQPGEVLEVDERALKCPEIVAAQARLDLIEVSSSGQAIGASEAAPGVPLVSRRSQRLGRTESKVG